MPVIPSEPMAPYLARVVTEAAAELHMRIQDPGDYPVPLSCQREVISGIGQAIGELAASLRAIAPMTRHQAVQRWLDNATWKIGGAHLEIWLAWRQLAPRDQRDRPGRRQRSPPRRWQPRTSRTSPAASRSPREAARRHPPRQRPSAMHAAAPGHGKPDNREEPISANPRSPAHTVINFTQNSIDQLSI